MSVHLEPCKKEKEIINKRNTKENRIICAVDGLAVQSDADIEYHHLTPFTSGRDLQLTGIATVCKKHHRELGQLSIMELRAYKEMEEFFSSRSICKLDDVLSLKLGNENTKKPLSYETDMSNNTVAIKLPDDDSSRTVPLSVCPSTGFQYFYAVLPLSCINNDMELQPRPLEIKRLWELYRHLFVNSQLTPSVCRLSGSHVYLFDGQHKAAAQIWAGRKRIECKVYLEPAIKILKETNLVAHDKLRQMPFFVSVLINKWASIFEEEWKEYIELADSKSEAGFVLYLVSRGRKKSEALHMIESNIYDSILEDENNRMKKYLAEYNSDLRCPLTVGRLKVSFFKKFITAPPLTINLEKSDRLRELERTNNVRLLNLFSLYALQDMWSPDTNDENHRISEKIFLNGSFKAVCAIIKDIIAAILELLDEDERKELLLRQISRQNWDLIENALSMLFSHRVWSDNSHENYNNLRLNNESQVRKYLARRGLSVNWIINNSYDSGNNFID